MARFVGIFSHFAYWSVFGQVNPIQLDVLSRKQMYVMLYELVENLKDKCAATKFWVSLAFPFVLLSLKVLTDFIFKNTYVSFFEEDSLNTNSPGVIAMDRVLHLADQMFDEGNIHGRFVFLETQIAQNMRGFESNDRGKLRSRLFSTSPYLNLLI